ncbi:MAG: hypothetical protein OSJ28_11385, partial [Desulfovibrio sp.]|nr:hypothetical protein [Desulfovibrio sp.]
SLKNSGLRQYNTYKFSLKTNSWKFFGADEQYKDSEKLPQGNHDEQESFQQGNGKSSFRGIARS